MLQMPYYSLKILDCARRTHQNQDPPTLARTAAAVVRNSGELGEELKCCCNIPKLKCCLTFGFGLISTTLPVFYQ